MPISERNKIGRGLTQGQMASVKKMEAFCLTKAI